MLSSLQREFRTFNNYFIMEESNVIILNVAVFFLLSKMAKIKTLKYFSIN